MVMMSNEMIDHEYQMKIEDSPYYELRNKNLLFYDISELGWSRYISAHINYLTKNGLKVSVSCDKGREVLYRDVATEILPIPYEYFNKFGHLLSASHHLHDPKLNIEIDDPDVLSKPFVEFYIDYKVIKNYTKFFGQRIFEPYHHSKESEEFCKQFRNCIVILPRSRNARFARRNIDLENWIKIIENLTSKFPHLDIISIGGKNGTLDIDLPIKNYYNLVKNDDNLDILVALCNMNKAITTFGTQSGIMHIATLCKSPSFIVGHDPFDMGMYTENWTNSEIYYFESVETEKGYDMSKINMMLKELNSFITFTEWKTKKIIF